MAGTKGACFLTVDVGTEGTKSALISEAGQTISTSYYEYELEVPEPLWATQDPRIWWHAVKETVKKVVASSKVDPNDIVAIGVCGQMHAPIPMSKEGEILYHQPPLWCDKRNIAQCLSLKSKVDEKDLLKITGNPITPAWMGLKIKWIKEKLPHIYEKTYKFLTPKDMIIYMLTGEYITDFSEASGSYLFDCRKLQWSPILAELLDIDLEKMPDIHPSHEIIGDLKQDVAQELSLKKNVAVVAGGGDFPCAMLGAGGIFSDFAVDIAGTSSLMAVSTEDLKSDERLLNLHHVVDNKWILFNEVEAGLLKWFKENFAESEKRVAEMLGRSAYQILDEEAEAVPAGSAGLIIFPHFIGERVLGRYNFRGVMVGLSLMHTKAHIFRALMESVAYELRRILELIEELTNLKINIIRLVGGGALSPLLRSIRANIYGRKIELLRHYQGGLNGLAILCMMGLRIDGGNLYKALEKFIQVSSVIEPDKVAHESYNYYYAAYKRLYNIISQFYEKQY
ncbi:MAG: FGGY family carbohydrate kinase [Nitrososphaerota archaeon]